MIPKQPTILCLVFARCTSGLTGFRLTGGSCDWRAEHILLCRAKQVKLPNLAGMLAKQEGGNGLDAKRDWGAMLSLGEQQRLAFGRLLANRCVASKKSWS